MATSAAALGTDQKPQPFHATQAADADCRRNWNAAARHFTQTAAALTPDPHGSTPAAELILRRQVHIVNCMHKRMQYFDLERAFFIPDEAR